MENDAENPQEKTIPPQLQNKLGQIGRQMAESAARFEKRNRCTNTTVFLMLSVALFYDLLQFGLDWIPFIGWIGSMLVGVYAWLTFYTWTSILGWNKADTAVKYLVTSERGVKFFARYVFPFIGIVPVVNAIPEITAGVLISILLIKAQDTLYNRSQGKIDENVIMEGIAFFDMFRNVYSDKWTDKPRYQSKNKEKTRPTKRLDKNKPYGGLHMGNEATDALRKQAVIGGGPTDSIIDVSRGTQERRNLEATKRKNRNDMLPPGQEGRGIPSGNQSNIPSDSSKNNGKTDSMSIHDELWELNAKPDLSKEDKERLLKAHWIMEHNHIEDKEKDDPVLLRAFERANRGEVIFDGSPEKRHGFKFSNVQIVNATNTIAGRDFDSLNPQYGNNGKSSSK